MLQSTATGSPSNMKNVKSKESPPTAIKINNAMNQLKNGKADVLTTLTHIAS